MIVQDSQRLERDLRRIYELRLWRDARAETIQEWRFTAPDGQSYTLNVGDFWPVVDLPVQFAATTRIPQEWAGQPVELDLWLGGEGFVSVVPGESGGLDPFHRSFRITGQAVGGEQVEVHAEVVPKGMFGSHIPEPRLEYAHLVIPETEVRALERDISMIIEACIALDDHEVVPHLLDALDAAFAALSTAWPSSSDVTVTRLLEGYSNPVGGVIGALPLGMARELLDETAQANPQGMRLWSLPPAPGSIQPLPEEARQAVCEARTTLWRLVDEIKQQYPPVGNLALSGHAHIDLAWLWPLAETQRKVRRTYSTVLRLMDRFEDFTFNQSSAQAYTWIENNYPEAFGRIRERVAEGRWEPVGGSWTECDCQITGGESFVRQLLYGQRYFQERFGMRCKVSWLPDVFGFSPSIPQLIRGAGMDSFFTIKLTWNETNTFPYDLFTWEGLDGSQVTAHMFRNPSHGYNGNITPSNILPTWRNFRGKRLYPECLFSFGWGDGGGGPTESMLENYQRLKDFPAMPRLHMTRVEDFFAALPREGLPKWVGELYLELHRGTLTSQAKVKALNRAAEHRLLEADAWSSLATLHGYTDRHQELEDAWKLLLLNQFHDILPGSSIREVYVDAHNQLEQAITLAKGVRDEALSYLAERIEATTGRQENVLLVASASLAPRPLSVLVLDASGSKVVDESGRPIPTQQTEKGLLVHDPGRSVPGLGWVSLAIGDTGIDAQPATTVSAESRLEGAVLENDLLRVQIGPDGTLHRVYDKTVDREVLEGRGNQLWAYVDKPRNWDAWDIDQTYELEGQEVDGVVGIQVVDPGPLSASVRVERRWRGSCITQTYRLLAGSSRLDIETDIDWHERQILLRALFPLAIRTHEATFETMYGSQHRPTHRNTSWDTVRFEVSGHRFADMSETGYGVALLNNAKYGYSAHDNVLGLSLLRSPVYPDPLADEGGHHFTYSLFPHEGTWAEAGVVQEAFALNSPLMAVTHSGTGGGLPTESGFMTAEGVELAIGSLKRAEDGQDLILRLYEPNGARGKSTLRFEQPPSAVESVNLLEEADGKAPRLQQEGNEVHVEVRPFQVFSLRLRF